MADIFIPKVDNKSNIFIPKIKDEEEENKVFIPEPFNVLEGSVIDKFDDSGKEIKKGFVKTIKDFFKSDKEDLANQTYNDPILESIAAIEKKYPASVVTYYGDTTTDERQNAIKRIQNKDSKVNSIVNFVALSNLGRLSIIKSI